MTWKGWTALGVLSAAIAVPILRKRAMHRGNNFNGDSFNPQGSETLSTMGGRNAPASDTWTQGGGTP